MFSMVATMPHSSVARTPDRTLPLQEEAEDEFGPSSKGPWKETGHGALDRISSPTPSSDLNPDGNSQRYDRHSGRGDTLNGRGIDENVVPQSKASDSTNRYSDKDGEDSGSYTPRSPTAPLPDHRSHDKYYQPPTQRTSPKVSSRVKSRNGSIDGLGLRTIDPSAFDSNGPSSAAPPTTTSERSSYVDHRQQQDTQYAPPKQAYQPQAQAQAPNPNPSYNYTQAQAPREPQASNRSNAERPPPPPASVPPQSNYPKNGYYDQAQVYPDDFQTYSEDPASFSYLHAYLASPRPDAPIPPTPHSQSAAPSPSPFPNGYGGKPMPGYSPIAPVGSPYPYPFTHVRRNPPASSGFSQYSSNYDPNHPAAIQEQLAKAMANLPPKPSQRQHDRLNLLPRRHSVPGRQLQPLRVPAHCAAYPAAEGYHEFALESEPRAGAAAVGAQDGEEEGSDQGSATPDGESEEAASACG
ncbi:hypothetical protein H1R20_g1201, partial [Candolleomyces eurysporus]